jgi:hypothetical protein
MISQRTFERVRRIELQLGVEPSHYEAGAATGVGATTAATGRETDAQRGQPPPAGARDREALEV